MKLKWTCSECDCEVLARDKPGRCMCGAFAWKPEVNVSSTIEIRGKEMTRLNEYRFEVSENGYYIHAANLSDAVRAFHRLYPDKWDRVVIPTEAWKVNVLGGVTDVGVGGRP